MLETATLHFVRTTPLFAGIPDQSCAALCESATVHHYEKGSHIILRGDRADYFYLIMSGWVKLYRETQEGAESIIGLMGRTDSFGETSIFSQDTHVLSAQVVEDCRAISIPARVLKQEVRENFVLIQRIMERFTQQMNKLQLENEHLSLMSASQRVGCLLLQISDGRVLGAQDIKLPYEKSLAANKLGMKPETFSRALVQLRDVGVTVQGDVFKLSNTEKLIDFVCSDCSACDQDCHFSQQHHCHAKDHTDCKR